MTIASPAGSIRLLSAAAAALFAVAGVTACSEQGSDRTSEVADAAPPAEGAPEWYLAQYPQHPDLRIKKVSQPGAGVYLIAYQAGSDREDALVDWFRAAYSQDGWSIDDENGDGRFTAVKDGSRGATVNVTGTSYVTMVTITAYEE